MFNFKGRWGYTGFFDVQQDVWLSYLLSLCHSRSFIFCIRLSYDDIIIVLMFSGVYIIHCIIHFWLSYLLILYHSPPVHILRPTNDQNWFSKHSSTRLKCFFPPLHEKFKKDYLAKREILIIWEWPGKSIALEVNSSDGRFLYRCLDFHIQRLCYCSLSPSTTYFIEWQYL